MVYVETLLQDSHSVCLAVRALQMPPSAVAMETPVTCPPPPSQSRISENSIGNLKIPPPSGNLHISKKKQCTNLALFILTFNRLETPKRVLYISSRSALFPKIILFSGREISYEPVHENSNNVVCATSKALDQPVHMHSLIRAFVSCLSIL